MVTSQEEKSGDIVFYLKGADLVMSKIVQYTYWMNEECGNMAREGLRTLVVAKKHLTEEQYQEFEVCIEIILFQTEENIGFHVALVVQTRLEAARLDVTNRSARVTAEIEKLEREMELLCVTGVEDKLQENVRRTLELLRGAGIKVGELMFVFVADTEESA